MSETHFCGALILAITFLLIIRYSLRKKNSFLNIREIVCDYWKMLSSLRHRVIFMATPISFGIGLTLISPIRTSVLETVCTAISILLGLLFATLGAIASGKRKRVILLTVQCSMRQSTPYYIYLACPLRI